MAPIPKRKSQRNRVSTLISSLFSPGNQHEDSPAISIPSTASHLLWTNDPPSENERTDIELALLHAETKRAELKTTLDQENSLEVGRIQRSLAELDAFINAHKPILSTLRHLPHDILSYIFTLCLEPIRTRPWNRTHWNTIPSFPLSHVCRWWRLVALETPILWTFLGDVRLNQKSGSNRGNSYNKFLETLLRRSKTLDLWIYVYAPFQELKTHHAIAPLVHHADRWRVVTFETTPSVVAAFQRVQHRLPRLRSISLDLWRGGEIPLDLFSDAPSLTEVAISGLNPRLELPWGQLKSFTGEQHKTGQGSQLEHIFKNSTNSLEYLAMTLRPNLVLRMLNDLKSSLAIPITFPNLKTMRLSWTPDSVGLGDFISVLTLPRLEELQLGSCSSTALLQFIRRSFEHSTRPPLKRLFLHDHASPRNMVDILRLVPHLEHFEVNLRLIYSALREMSGAHKNSVVLLPELKSLVLKWDGFAGMDEFAALTRSRCKRTTCAETDRNHRRRTLTDVSLIFLSRRSAFLVQRYLNSWCQADKDYDTWRDNFHFRPHAIGGGKVAQRRPAFAAGIDKVLSEIKLSEPHDVDDIYASGLYGPLQDLALSTKRQVPGDDKYHLRERAKAILKGWDAIIQADITDVNSCWRKNWVARGECTLQYLPDDYVFRDLSEAVELILGAGHTLKD